jgi:hypothetical protein
MSLKEDLLRAKTYGTDPYYAAIRAVPSYQAELERTRTDYVGRSWIESPFKFPKFTDEKFEEMRVAYQAKYGSKINIPAFQDIVHWKIPPRISTEEMAAHRFAKKRKLPSPLSSDQLQMLTERKIRFLRALASPTPKWLRNVGAIQNALDDAEDAITTTAVLGRWAAKISPRLLGRAVPTLGWILLGSDILNLGSLFTWIRFAANPMNCKNMDLADKNPFHHKSALKRALKARRSWATVGEILEILQTTDQVFGVGLSLGGIVGAITDTAMTAERQYFNVLEKTLAPIEIPNLTPPDSFLKYLSSILAPREIPRPKQYDAYIKIIENLVEPIQKPALKLWQQLKTLKSSWILSTFKDDVPKNYHTRAYIAANTAAQTLAPWWIQNDPLLKFKPLRTIKIPAPPIDNQIARDVLEDQRIDPDAPQLWPHLDVPVASAEDLLFTYAPMIKDSLQTYCHRYSKDYEGMIGGWSAVECHDTILSLLSDDGEIRVGRSAIANVTQDMAQNIRLIPPDTPDSIIHKFADWIIAFERRTGESPKVSEFTAYGRSIGIEWMSSFPRVAFEKVEALFPGWQAIQDQVGKLFVPD